MEEVQEYVTTMLGAVGVSRLAAGTVVTSPGAVASDQLTVVMEPSALAVPVKSLRGRVLPGERVVLALVGADPRRSEWVCLGPFGEPASVSSESISAAATTSGNNDTTSASYVNMAGTGSVTSFGLTKRFVGTRIRVTMHVGLYRVTDTATATVGVNIGGTDYDLRTCAAELNAHREFSAVRHISGIATGALTIQAIWRKSAGNAGGILRRDVNDWLTVSAEEV